MTRILAAQLALALNHIEPRSNLIASVGQCADLPKPIVLLRFYNEDYPRFGFYGTAKEIFYGARRIMCKQIPFEMRMDAKWRRIITDA